MAKVSIAQGSKVTPRGQEGWLGYQPKPADKPITGGYQPKPGPSNVVIVPPPPPKNGKK